MAFDRKKALRYFVRKSNGLSACIRGTCPMHGLTEIGIVDQIRVRLPACKLLEVRGVIVHLAREDGPLLASDFHVRVSLSENLK